MFEDSLVESKISGGKKTFTVVVSALAHVAVVSALIIVPLLVTDALPAGGGTGTGGILLAPGWGSAPDVAPPPPLGAATAAKATSTPAQTAQTSTDTVELTSEVPVSQEPVLVANPSVVLPRAVPERMAALSGAGAGDPLGEVGGRDGGLVGGHIDGRGISLNGILGGTGKEGTCASPLGCGQGGPGWGPPGLDAPTAPPPPPVRTPVAVAPKTVTPPPVKIPPPPPVIQVSQGAVLANCVRCPAPEYPALARAARVTDTVVLSARINRQGTIENLTFVRGHTLLRAAAEDAVRGWQYKPMLLNGEPVEVQTTISISFVFR